jgi:hypothetical protein
LIKYQQEARMMTRNKNYKRRTAGGWWAIPLGLGLGLGWVAAAGLSIYNALGQDKTQQ